MAPIAPLLATLLLTSGTALARSLVFTDVTVIDVAEGVARPAMTVVVTGNRITAVGKTTAVEVPAGATTIDGGGRYLIPGLWDMHVHSVANVALDQSVESVAARDWHFPLFLAFGVTGVRDMNDGTGDVTLSLTRSVQRSLRDGSLPGPRFFAAGPSIDGDPALGSNPTVVRTASDARVAVDTLADNGADFVKPYENLSREAYFAIIDQAKRRGLPVYGHVPFRVKPEEAAEAGQRTVEHPDALAAACSSQADAIRERFTAVLASYDSLPEQEQFLVQFRLYRALYDTRDPAVCKSALEVFRRNGVAVTADLVAFHHVVHADEILADETSMRLVPPAIRRNWQEQFDSESVKAFQSILRPIIPLELENVGLANEAGVTLLAATDVGVPLQVPGLSLHRELVRLVEAGLTPPEALRTATLNPAQVLGLEDSLGTVEPDKLADLVLLDANPLEVIRNTQQIRAVVADGRLYRRADLDRLLADAQSLDLVVPNDNRSPAGTLRDGVLELDLEARLARWRGEARNLSPDVRNPSVVTVMGFAEQGAPVTIPGPLIRVPQGTKVHVRVRNSIPASVSIGVPGPALREEGMSSVSGRVLVVRGLRAATVPDDTLRVPRGEVREVRYRADKPGTYFYWATPSDRTLRSWTGRDAQLAGAIIVDPAGTTPDPAERIFVITMLDMLPDPNRPAAGDDIFRRAINGLSWPDTERFRYAVGETVRWRWINASFESHPMHLHGFHYRLLARGDGTSETVFPEDEQPLIVTERMTPGSTFRMEWVPTRPGNWLFHCHILDHIVPAIERDEEARGHDLHDVRRHALEAMGGLVLGMSVSDDGVDAGDRSPDRRVRLVALERSLDDDRLLRGFALEDDAEPAGDSPSVPAPPLVVTRDETTEVTVVNQFSEPTTIHWHGMELESFYDGVAGWSGIGSRIAPLILPRDSFTVRMTPPRAGTFIYHTHMDETDQLVQGMAGPLIVLEPGEEFDPETDRIFLIGGQDGGDYLVNVNGRRDPPPATFQAGTGYRLRFVHITQGVSLDVALTRAGVPVHWRAAAKDGADLPAALQVESDAGFHTNTGETFDFLWTPEETGDAVLSFRYAPFFSDGGEVELRQIFRVH